MISVTEQSRNLPLHYGSRPAEQLEMTQNLKIPIRTKNSKPTSSVPALLLHQWTREILLPTEIISHILSYIPRQEATQSTFWACTLVSRAWYSSSIGILYERPYLHGGNFSQFATTVCPSKNAHIRLSALATLVRRLDMGELVHNSSKSLTARLLGRLKGNIVEFVAPQASFAINSFAPLSKCTKLRHLDLSLISASISNKLLFQTLTHLLDLETLFFPRSSSLDADRSSTPYTWPPKLKALHLAGGVNDYFLETHLTNTPPSLQRLSIQHCSQIHTHSLLETLTTLGPQLTQLTIRHPMSQLPVAALDYILLLCPSLIAFRISADFISNSLFESIPERHPLRILDIECSPQAGADIEISPGAVYDAVENDKLPDLRSVRASARLAWNATTSRRQDVEDLVEVLEDAEMERPLGIEAEVWASMPD